jgi:hypothetical protein
MMVPADRDTNGETNGVVMDWDADKFRILPPGGAFQIRLRAVVYLIR